ncbi:MAG: low molecular weight phosphatase family protein [Actinobacteria bacterium]|nr:low molecular weight phosphatase family protein [Actinomycetota bacterium]
MSSTLELDQPTPDADGGELKVLFVCTANMCRSPMAEHLFAAQLRCLPSSTTWLVGSAGTHVRTGSQVHELVREVLAERGISVPPTSSRQVTVEHLEHADLIVTAGRSHRSWVVERAPSAVRRTFTLPELGRLCAAGRDGLEPSATASGASLLGHAARGRRRLQPVTAHEDLIKDPMGGDIGAFRRCADQISASIAQVLGRAAP